DTAHRGPVFRAPRECAVEVHDMDPLGALFDEALRHAARPPVVDRRALALSFLQAHHLAAEQIDRGNHEHSCLRKSSSPARWLFSGWNWVAKMLSFFTAAQNSTLP